MKTTTFTALRNNAKKVFDAVEKGETFEVYRHGKPVALLQPIAGSKSQWKNITPILVRGVSLSEAILADRKVSKR